MSIIEKTIYTTALNHLSQALNAVLLGPKEKEIKQCLSQGQDLVQYVKGQFQKDDVSKIPVGLRKAAVNYLPSIRRELVRDLVKMLRTDPKYQEIYPLGRGRWQDYLERSINLFVLWLKTYQG